MPFVVVKGPETNFVEVIPTKWLCDNGAAAMFPKKDEDIERFCVKETGPEDGWVSHPIEIKSVIFDVYSDANCKAESYANEVTDTDSNAGEECPPNRKRKSRPVPRFLNSYEQVTKTNPTKNPASARSGSARSGSARSGSARSGSARNVASCTESAQSVVNQQDSSDDDDTNQGDENTLDSQFCPGSPVLQGSSATTSTPSVISTATTTATHTPTAARASTVVANQSSTSTVVGYSAFEAMTVRKMNLMDQKLNEILAILNGSSLLEQADNRQAALPFTLPISNSQSLKELNDFLKIEENRKRLLLKLPQYKKTDLGTRIPLMVAEIISLPLAARMNWKGSGKEDQRGEKKEGLLNYEFVHAFLLQYVGGAADDAGNRIKKWLSNAPAKLKAQSASKQ